MSTEPIRVALAGFGAWGQQHARAIANINHVEIVSVYCHSERSANAAAQLLPDAERFSDYDEMLEKSDYDVVDITVPNDVHSRFAISALDAGANVFLEKPLGLTLEQCDTVAEAAERNNRLVALNHELRVSHQWRAVRDVVSDGLIGAVRYQHLSLYRNAFRQGSEGWRYDPARVGSWILEELVHFFDLIIWYAHENGKPAKVTAYGNGLHGELTDNFTAVLEWSDGSMAVLNQCLSGFEHHTLLEIGGTDGGVRSWWSGALDRTLDPSFELKVKSGTLDVETVDIPRSGEVFELEENLRAAFAGFQQGHSILPPNEARSAVEICLAAEESFRQGQPVELAN